MSRLQIVFWWHPRHWHWWGPARDTTALNTIFRWRAQFGPFELRAWR